MTLPLHGYPDWQNPLHTADLASVNQTYALGAHADNAFVVYDMRPYSSYSVYVLAALVGVATQFDCVQIGLNWTADITGLIPVYTERYEIFADDLVASAFPSPYGRFQLQDSVHGPYFYLSVTNNSPDNMTITNTVLGNSRSLGKRYVSNTQSSFGGPAPADIGAMLAFFGGVAGGATTRFALPLNPGPAQMRRQTQGQPAIFGFATPSGTTISGYIQPINQDLHEQIILPRSAVLASISNTGGAAANFSLELTGGWQNW